jgi:predicted NUDIX family phosphoesterase
MNEKEAAENILVIPAEVFDECCVGERFTGFLPLDVRTMDQFSAVFSLENPTFKPRGEMEEDTGWKQLIPYTVVRHTRGSAFPTEFLYYQRAKSQAEIRLAGKYSVGIGGHIVEDDLELLSHEDEAFKYPGLAQCLAHAEDDLLMRGMLRELFEELDWDGRATDDQPCGWNVLGLLNDERTHVGKVHLGIVVVVDLPTSNVRSHDPYVRDLTWTNFDSLIRFLGHYDFEEWSRLIVNSRAFRSLAGV